jgi:hypothetical protein
MTLGNHVQVNVQLIDAESGAQLWADRFESDRANRSTAQNRTPMNRWLSLGGTTTQFSRPNQR